METLEAGAMQEGQATGRARPKLLYLVTEDWYFCSHRLDLACAALRAGFDVAVATRVSQDGERIAAAGIRVLPLRLRRESYNPWSELSAVGELVRIYRAENPDIVHHVALKPVLYGSLAAAVAGRPKVVNAMAGFGFAVASPSLAARMIRPFIRQGLKLALNAGNSRVILQNPDDRAYCADGIIPDLRRVVLVRGSGVDLERFAPTPEPSGAPVVAFISRMLRDKGLEEFVRAAEILRGRGMRARFILVGESDPANPASISPSALERWNSEQAVEYWGRHADMPEVFRQVHIVCLPSYREGLPKVLIEAAACGKPIVATDVPGCREVVRHGMNGLLVAPRDAAGLASALEQLIQDAPLRHQMGERGRRIAETVFGIQGIVEQTLEIYRDLLADGSLGAAVSR